MIALIEEKLLLARHLCHTVNTRRERVSERVETHLCDPDPMINGVSAPAQVCLAEDAHLHPTTKLVVGAAKLGEVFHFWSRLPASIRQALLGGHLLVEVILVQGQLVRKEHGVDAKEVALVVFLLDGLLGNDPLRRADGFSEGLMDGSR